MTDFTIRTATADDARRIAEISIIGWRAAYRGLMPATLLDGLDLDERQAGWERTLACGRVGAYLVSNDEEVVGFCSVMESRDADTKPGVTAEIPAIYICPEFWHQGLGRLLWNQVHAGAKAKGYRELSLWVLTTNTPAHKFYAALGFKPDGATKVETSQCDAELPHIRYRRDL